MTAHIEAGQILSPSAGVVSSVTVTDGATCEEGSALFSLQSTDSWLATVSVDELDINSIEVGQNVDVELDSLPSEVFEGSVTAISDMGTASGGITTYNVNVNVADDDRFKINMTLNCEIKAQEATGVVLLPINDLRTSGNASYVMVKVDRTNSEKAAIQALINSGDIASLAEYMGADAKTLGISVLSDWSELLTTEVRAVETGIENAYYVEIKSGLSEGDMVLQSAETNDDSGQFGFMMGGMGEISGATMPSRPIQRGDFSGGPGGN
jgi:HlyD family secretion protein